MRFGWRVVKHVKSNAIVYSGAGRTLGIGAGQMSRVDSSRIAVWKANEAGLSLKGSIMASDAMLPFADGLNARHRGRCHRLHPARWNPSVTRRSSLPPTRRVLRWCLPSTGTSGIRERE